MPAAGAKPRSYSATPYPPGTIVNDQSPAPPTPARPRVSIRSRGEGRRAGVPHQLRGDHGARRERQGAGTGERGQAPRQGGHGWRGRLRRARAAGRQAGAAAAQRQEARHAPHHDDGRDASGNKTVTRQTSTAKRSANGRGCPSAPVLTNFKLGRSKFRAAAHGVSITAFPKKGPTMSYKDTPPADTTWTVDRLVNGIVKGHNCVVPPKRIHGKPRRCTGYRPVATFVRHDRRGRNPPLQRQRRRDEASARQVLPRHDRDRHHTSGKCISVPYRIHR